MAVSGEKGSDDTSDSEKKNTNASGHKQKKALMIDPTSPYYLTSGDNPGIIVTPVQLKGDNYDEWSKAVRNAFRAKKKLGFLDGKILKPANDSSELEDWLAMNAMLVGWIFNTIDPSLRSSLSYLENVKDLWDDLKERFSIGNDVRIHQLKTDIANCKQYGQNVAAYYGKLKTMWEALASYMKNPTCSCAGCTCDAAQELAQEREKEKVHQFLMGLDDAIFGTVRSNILSMSPLPNINRVYAMVMTEETHKSLARMRDERTDAVSFAIQTTPHAKSGQNRGGDRGTCTNCGKHGHEANDCFQIIGYPDWWNSGKNGRGAGRGNRGTRSKGIGQGRETQIANAAQVQQAHSAVGIQTGGVTDERGSFPGLSNDQWSALMNILNSHKPTSSTEKLTGKQVKNSWLLDTGASNHMTGDINLLTKLIDVSPCPVGLPDGRNTIADKEGTVNFGKGLALNNVLYVPNLACNLISVSQLIHDSNCVVTFSNKLCVIQDRTSRTVIGVGEQRNGVYHFRAVTFVQTCKTSGVDSFTMWHRRMGHPSSQIVGLLPCIHVTKKDKHEQVCDICLRAKQTRDIFIPSQNKANEPFDLIHCDVWGPYRVRSSCCASYFLTIVDDFSRAVWIYLLVEKSEVGNTLKNFCTMVVNQFNRKVKIVRSDNGTEFRVLKGYFVEQGMIHQTSMVDTPQQNGRVERKHRHILNVARALRFQANLPIEFWGECVLTVGYLINRTPSIIHKGKSPYEILFGQTPTYSHIRTFGCLCYAHNRPRQKDKFGD